MRRLAQPARVREKVSQAMRYEISAHDAGIDRSGVAERTASVIDRIAILLSTPQNTCPLYRAFGLPMRFLDKPMNAGIPIAVAEVTEGLLTWIPEASLINVTFAIDETDIGKIIPIVEVEIADEL